ncbi:MAG: 4Fe-4S binding protein [Methanocellales archaeon]
MIEINKNFCKGCQICVHFCPRDVFKISNELNRLGYYFIYPAAPEKCIHCGICEKYCPDFAIKIKEKGERE